MRAASMTTAEPAALSVAPEPLCHESKCAPTITISSARSVPGISAMTFSSTTSSGVNVASKSRSMVTFCPASARRMSRLACSSRTANCGTVSTPAIHGAARPPAPVGAPSGTLACIARTAPDPPVPDGVRTARGSAAMIAAIRAARARNRAITSGL